MTFHDLAIQLPYAITPTIAGLVVGATVGVVGFVLVLLLVGRPKRPRAHVVSPDNVVFIPPYATAAHATRPSPVPQTLASGAGGQAAAPPCPHTEIMMRAPYASAGFRPSTELSARAFAKMGYAIDGMPSPPPSEDAFDAGPELSHGECELAPDEVLAVERPVSVSPVLVLAAERMAEPPKDRKSDPHPLGIIRATSPAMRGSTPPSGVMVVASASSGPMRAASIADLDMDDDAPTQIAETIFDEPPQPRRRSEPPRIRPIAPTPPRHAASGPPSIPTRASLPEIRGR